MRRLTISVLLMLLAALPARAEEVVAALSQTRVALTATFEGSEILVFGAVRRETPMLPEDVPLEVIVTISGPTEPVTVWRKARVAGVWMNVDGVRINEAPSFYAVATTAPLTQALSSTEDLRHRVSIDRAIRTYGAYAATADAPAFTAALRRLRERDDLYQMLEGEVEMERDTLFSTRISLPANLTEGVYTTRIFLTREGAVVDRFDTAINVQKVGIERWLFQLAQQQPLAYGALAVLIAVLAGWGASAAFRYFRS